MADSVDAKLLKATKFPPEFNQKVDMQKVNVEVMKKWIAGKISDILGNEDDVVIELCFNLLEGNRYPDVKQLQIQLTGFLDKDTPKFCKELWKLCLSAQANAQGVPKELLEAKKLELIQEKIESEKAAEESRKRREDEQQREREVNAIRNRERGERGERGDRGRRGGGGGGGGRGGDSWRGGRGDRDFDRSNGRGFDRRPMRYSRSPPRRRDSRERGPFRGGPREFDSYVPSDRGGRGRNDRRRPVRSESRSPSLSRSKSRSRSPPRRRQRSPSRSRTRSPRRRSRSPNRRADTYRGRGGRGRGRTPDRGVRRRSSTPSDISRSRSRSRSPAKRRRSISSSLSRSPPPASRRARRNSSSRSRSPSMSRSRSHTPRRRASHSRERARSPTSPEKDVDAVETGASSRRAHERDETRLTRSNSQSITPPRRRRRSPSRSPDRSSGRKRRRSIQRYEPASKRRRNSSSVSSTDRRRKADTEDESDRASPRPDIETIKANMEVEPNEMKDSKRQASELRERLLREKIKKMRTSSIDSVTAQANTR